MKIKEVIKKIILQEKYSSATYISYLKKLGVGIGDDCTIYVPSKTLIDLQYPWLISIGNHVRITQGVIILTHDYSWSVLKKYKSKNISEGLILGASGRVAIGDNVFIGMNSIIMRGVSIGDNVIIGAGSVVTKDCESNGVYAGNPAHRIMGIEEYYGKRLENQLKEATVLAKTYFQRYREKPPIEVFHEYFMLFTDDIDDLTKANRDKMRLCQNYKESEAYLKGNKPYFRNYEEFMNYCFEKEKEVEEN